MHGDQPLSANSTLNTAIDMFKENPTQHIGTTGVVLVTQHVDPSDEFFGSHRLTAMSFELKSWCSSELALSSVTLPKKREPRVALGHIR